MVAHLAARAGATMAFGHPGGEVVIFINALERAGIPFVLTRHETQAAFMAGGMGELTGRPAICVSTLGPGACNMVTGVASALLERAPVIAVTADIAAGAPSSTTHQVLQLSRLYAPVTKHTMAVTDDTGPAEIAAIMAETIIPRPGPVHLSLSSDTAERPAVVARDDTDPNLSGDSPHNDADVPTAAQLAAAGQMIARASRPAILIGVGAAAPQVARPVSALAYRIGAPIAVLPKAKGIVPEDDLAFLGVLEMAGQGLVVESLTKADLLVAIGLDPVEMDIPWPFKAPVLHIDWLPNAEQYYPAELELIGNPAQVINRLVSTELGRDGRWQPQAIAASRAAVAAYVRPAASRLQPWQVVDAVRSIMPQETIATCDVGAHKLLVGQIWTTYQPRSFLMANGLSSMGYAVPVAAAACIACPGRPVIAFLGDGGLGMYLGELETLTRTGSNVLLVVFADNSLELIRRAQLRRNCRCRVQASATRTLPSWAVPSGSPPRRWTLPQG